MTASQKISEPKPFRTSQMTGLTRVRTPSPYDTSEMFTKATIAVYGAKKEMQ